MLQSLPPRQIQEQCQEIYAENRWITVTAILRMVYRKEIAERLKLPDYPVGISPWQNRLPLIPMLIAYPIVPVLLVHIPESFSIYYNKMVFRYHLVKIKRCDWLIEIFLRKDETFALFQLAIMGHCVECRMS